MNENIRSSWVSKRVLCMAEAYAATVRAAIATVLALLIWAGETPVATASENAGSESGKLLCVIVPHFKDEYWLSVGYGLTQEAAATGTEVLMFESGGYHALEQQIALLDTCAERNVSAVLLGVVSADDASLLAAVEKASATVPVVALVNELRSPHLSGAVGVDWQDMGQVIGAYLSQRHPPGSKAISAALVTGPAVSGWSPLLEAGLYSELRNSSVTIKFVGRSDTGLREQLAQVEAAIDQVPDLDVIIGSAPAIEGAMGLAANSADPFPRLVSTYISHSVRRGVQSGKVTAVAFDDPAEQGRLGVRIALSARLGVFSTHLIGPDIELVAANSGQETSLELAPAAQTLQIE